VKQNMKPSSTVTTVGTVRRIDDPQHDIYEYYGVPLVLGEVQRQELWQLRQHPAECSAAGVFALERCEVGDLEGRRGTAATAVPGGGVLLQDHI
jgi:hypothetical protein